MLKWATVKEEFATMDRLRKVRGSYSLWASPHLTYWPCGNFHVWSMSPQMTTIPSPRPQWSPKIWAFWIHAHAFWLEGGSANLSETDGLSVAWPCLGVCLSWQHISGQSLSWRTPDAPVFHRVDEPNQVSVWTARLTSWIMAFRHKARSYCLLRCK